MRSILNWLVVSPLLAAASCTAAPAEPDDVDIAALQACAGPHVHGSGQYDLNGLAVDFSFNAVQTSNGSANGQFHVHASYDGLEADFRAKVTCLAVDEVSHRAWVGGVVTKNKSTDPDYAAPIYQPGKDVWFRVVDYSSGNSGIADRSTFLGFEGAAGFLTSAAYCAGRPWPDADARTWPVTSGNITVKP
jgi:hypothetical protein